MTDKPEPTSYLTANGAHIRRLPLEAFPNFWAYAHLVQVKDLRVLIDCGSGTDASHADLLAGLAQVGLAPGHLTHVLLTHAHFDHFGGLSRLRPLTRARIGVHELDWQTVCRHEARLALISRRLDDFLIQAGLEEKARHTFLDTYRFTKSIYRSVEVDFTYEAAGMQVGPFDLIHLPGHCPGHIALRLDDIVFCGDMVVEGVTPHLSPGVLTPYGGLEHYLASLSRLQAWALGARLVLNGHDQAIHDLGERVDATRKNLNRRLTQVLQVLDSPLTVAEACRAVYGEMDGYNALLVMEKAGAYVEYLYERGLLEIANRIELEQGGRVVRYIRLKEALESGVLIAPGP